MLKRAILALVAVILPFLASASTVTVSWVNATKYEDGANITDMVGVKIYRSTVAGQPGSLIATVPAPGTSYVDAASPFGTTVYYSAATTTSGHGDSVLTAQVSKVNPQAAPLPPTGLTVAATTAYMILRQDDRFVALPVGTVPGDTACDSSNGAIAAGVTYYAVPTAKVTWYGTSQPTVVVARCS